MSEGMEKRNILKDDFDWEIPLAIPEKSDIEARAICSKAQTNAVAASFEGILIRNAE